MKVILTKLKNKPIEVLFCGSIAGDYVRRIRFAKKLFSSYSKVQIYQFAERNQLTELISHTLHLVDGYQKEKDEWAKPHEDTRKRIKAYFDELDKIAKIIYDYGIKLAVLKNGGIARGIYFCPGCCPMGDIDVLVEKRHFRLVHGILIKSGFKFEYRSPLEKNDISFAERSGGSEYWKILPNGEKLWLELQWRSIAGRWICPEQEPATEELLARSIPISGTAARLLSSEDNLLQVSLHAAKHTYVRAPGFRIHLDVERIVRSCHDLDWSIFIKRVKKLQVKTAVFFSLFIPYELFRTPIPGFVFDELSPAAWKKNLIISWLNRVGLFNPHERKFGKIGYIVFNALLYDDFRGLLRSILPARAWMKERYGFSNSLLLPWYHIRRLMNLALHRVST